jgi:hypothetical protein
MVAQGRRRSPAAAARDTAPPRNWEILVLRRTTIGVLIGLLALGACSSVDRKDTSPPKPTTTVPNARAGWDANALAALDKVVAKIKRAFPGQCADALPLAHDEYAHTASIIHSDVPLAVIDCNALGEQLELSAFQSAAVRAAWVKQRTSILCGRAKKGKYALDGVHWVVSDNWSVQPDTQGVTQELVDKLGATYQAERCPGVQQIDWEPAGVARVQQLRAQLARQPRIRCSEFELLDRSQYAHLQSYAGRLPAAFARCRAASGSAILIAAFSDKSVDRDAFVDSESKTLCNSLQGVGAVTGPDWAVIAAQANIAALAGVATGGTALPPAC